MSLKIFNTLSRREEVLEPIEPGLVRFYTCGPTVYNFAHIGNFRAYVFEDLLRRQIKVSGFKVCQVMNLTDVDDKTIRGAKNAGMSLADFTARYKKAFFDDIAVLNIERAEYYPAATDHIPEMIELIKKLMEKGYAYKSQDGSVYFAVSKFPSYGKLAHLDTAGLKAGARVIHDEYEKESLADFALWKAWDEGDGDVYWDSPWGRGRPGWHIECSAMGMKYLGESFDIHTGGIDNMFPHHENEIAQSEAATGKQFVKYWMHCEHLRVNGEKMSKSLGNFYTLRDLLEKGYRGREIRYVLISAHYRQTLNFTFDALNAARVALARVDDFVFRIKEIAGSKKVIIPKGWKSQAWVHEYRNRFLMSMENDLNSPQALAALFDFIVAGNKAISEGKVTPEDAEDILSLLEDMDKVLGVIIREEDKPDEKVLLLVNKREEARKAKNWELSDQIRSDLFTMGWEVRDTPAGPKLRKNLK